MAYVWLESYITGRAQIIHVGNRHSSPSKVLYGVPQGSLLGPVLYVLYTSDVAILVEALGLGAHLYADDTQLYGHYSPANFWAFELASRVLRAIDSIHEWMSSNRLSQHRQDTIHLAWYEAQSCQERNRSAPQSTSVPDWTYICEESWLHYRSRVKHEGPYHQTLPVVLLPASSNMHGSTFTYIISHPNFGPCLHLHASRFLQQPSLWDKCLPPWPSPIGPKFCCTFDPQNRQIWSNLGCNSAWPSLALGSVSYSIQAQLHEQLPGWPCTGVLPDRAMPLREWHSSKAQPSVVVPGSAPGLSISKGTIREKRFLRLLTIVVELTSCRLLHNEHQLFRKRLKTHYMQQSMLCHWRSMSTVWSLLLLLLLLLTIITVIYDWLTLLTRNYSRHPRFWEYTRSRATMSLMSVVDIFMSVIAPSLWCQSSRVGRGAPRAHRDI